jgi:hypothetical protein
VYIKFLRVTSKENLTKTINCKINVSLLLKKTSLKVGCVVMIECTEEYSSNINHSEGKQRLKRNISKFFISHMYDGFMFLALLALIMAEK